MMNSCRPKINLSLIAFALLTILISSCDKPNLDGHWHVYYGEERERSPFIWDIRNDSLFPIYDNAIEPDSFRISRNKIEIIWPDSKWQYDYEYFGDSCLLYHNDTLKLLLRRKSNCRFYDCDVELKINMDLPDFSENEVEIFDENDSLLSLSSYIFLGCPLDSSRNEFIQLNDRLSVLSDIGTYLYGWDYHIMLFIDKNLKMKHIVEVLLEMRYNQIPRCSYAFDIKEDIKHVGLITKKLFPFEMGLESYPGYYMSSKEILPPPPPPQQFSLLKEIHKMNGLEFNLKNDTLYLQKRKPIIKILKISSKLTLKLNLKTKNKQTLYLNGIQLLFLKIMQKHPCLLIMQSKIIKKKKLKSI